VEIVVVIKQVGHPVRKDVHGVAVKIQLHGLLRRHGIENLAPSGETIFRRANFFHRRTVVRLKVVAPRREEIFGVESLPTLPAATFTDVGVDKVVTPRRENDVLNVWKFVSFKIFDNFDKIPKAINSFLKLL
jgi:hypothetical protein